MITFTPDNIPMPSIQLAQVERWIRSVAADHGFSVGDLHYIFCNDEKILAVNQEFLQHDYFTDIITFDYCEGDRLSGDLFISVDSVRENAQEYGTEFKEELNRVIVHGILHLIGYDDHNDKDIAMMRKKENYYLSLRELV